MRRIGNKIFITYHPHKGVPVLDGYIEDPNNKHMFLPTLKPCDFRAETYHNENCCGKLTEKPIITYKCVATDITVTSKECEACQTNS